MAYDDDEDDIDEEGEDIADDGSTDSDACPKCGKPVYEDADRCPHCGSYITKEDIAHRKPLWLIIAAIICIAAMIWFFVL
jgi:hypothetical protein